MTTTATAAAPPADDFAAARAKWNAASAGARELNERIEGMRLSLSLSHAATDDDRVPDALRRKAAPFMQLAHRRRGKLLDMLAVAEVECVEAAPAMQAAREEWDAACRAETNRLAGDLQARHRVAVLAMARALEALSQAISDEREVRAELAARAPLPASAKLPDLSSDLLIGTLADFGSPMQRWRRRVRKLGVLP